MDIGERIKDLRTANKLTQQQIAEILGISRVNYTRYETNVNKPDYDILVKIADYYEVSTDFLLGRKNFP